ncbi:putative MAF protein [Actinobacillus pleuropneumoniae]|uniref:dTTP/UTP pyrophosphatase n=1 Tax=Actinobacillus pleuropneumoniae serotype 3 (strain JL03) TaxID=434271 RepID=B0BQ09_ACTPJ|nr:Maf family protein [Actinobacillus pleuropneumoniae]ABY69644.1 putative MAF protein [Actinobacillus pleuropneumoniae serovar 3 str. JL03]KIE90713.1 putative MAF protein [Actinobacillus pleuropneumoniae]KIE90823.1 putative MAF protein [Actinobacillus pleuropneumoniae]KIE90867.1 putative MAF protein [Actinobacillus pleuropneumoniae]KIE96384.1 putative MAF protein [Actinobacillus pleuropneumoniae]
MSNKQIYLASNSPRRWELLKNLGLDLLRLSSEIDESPQVNEKADEYCLRIAKQKNQEAQAVRIAENLAEHPILTADTTVSIDGKILGKPKDEQDAFAMLKMLSGRTHQVFTAVCISYRGKQVECLHTSEVSFRRLTDAEIHAYIATGEPMDKAGAYGIQQFGGVFVERLSGSFTGVMGLPVFETAELLKQFDLQIF